MKELCSGKAFSPGHRRDGSLPADPEEPESGRRGGRQRRDGCCFRDLLSFVPGAGLGGGKTRAPWRLTRWTSRKPGFLWAVRRQCGCSPRRWVPRSARSLQATYVAVKLGQSQGRAWVLAMDGDRGCGMAPRCRRTGRGLRRLQGVSGCRAWSRTRSPASEGQAHPPSSLSLPGLGLLFWLFRF